MRWPPKKLSVPRWMVSDPNNQPNWVQKGTHPNSQTKEKDSQIWTEFDITVLAVVLGRWHERHEPWPPFAIFCCVPSRHLGCAPKWRAAAGRSGRWVWELSSWQLCCCGHARCWCRSRMWEGMRIRLFWPCTCLLISSHLYIIYIIIWYNMI